MKTGKLLPQGKFINAWQLVHESQFEEPDTKLLLHFDNDVTDYATGKTVTNTNVTFSSTAWKFNSHSAVFNGTNAYLSVPDSTDWAFGTNNFTIDVWMQTPSSWSVNDTYTFTHQFVDANNRSLFYWSAATSTTTGNIAFFWKDAGTVYALNETNTSYLPSTWYHFALVRNGNNFYLYKNGTQVATTVISASYPDFASVLYIGRGTADGASWTYAKCNMDELRIVNGLAKWTSNFTPPTAPYVGRVASYPITADRNTVLMLSGEGAQDSTLIIDEVGHTVTAAGGACINKGGSLLLDGTGDYLSLANSSDWSLGTGDFTIDFWLRYNAFPASPNSVVLVGQWQDGNNYWGIRIQNSSGTQLYTWENIVGGVTLSSFQKTSPSLITGQWYHVALVRSGNTWRFYQDGTQVGSDTTDTNSVGNTGILSIGARGDGAGSLNGWMDEIRLSKGVARWTSNFTPQTIPYLQDSYTKLLIHADGKDASTRIEDDTGKTVTVNGNAQIDTAQYQIPVAKYGNSCMLFDSATSSYLSIPDGVDWYFGTQDLTIDLWYRAKTSSASLAHIFTAQYENGYRAWGVYKDASPTNKLHMTWIYHPVATFTVVGEYRMTNNWTFNVDQWYHLAFVRNGGNGYIFIDGVAQQLDVLTPFLNNNLGDVSAPLYVGTNGADIFDGWIDDLRITKGFARWTTNFTPPTRTTATVNGDQDEIYKLLADRMTAPSGSNVATYIQFNGDTGTNYGYQSFVAGSTVLSADRQTARVGVNINTGTTNGIAQSNSIIYAKSGYTRAVLSDFVSEISGTTATYIESYGSSWNNSTAPIASISLVASSSVMDCGTKFLLYRKVK